MTLRTDIATAAGKRRYVRRLFATIADRYDFITVALSYGQDRRWKRRLIAHARVTADDTLLDVACGTGDLLFAGARSARLAVGLDVTDRMLQLARRRAVRMSNRAAGDSEATRGPLLVQGDMQALPFGSGRFSVVTAGYGLRNVPDLPGALTELHRVLAGGGRFLSLDFNRPPNRLVRAAYLGYLSLVGSILGTVLHGDPDTYRYIPESIRIYPGADGVADLMRAAGFVDVTVTPVLRGLMTIHAAAKP